MSTSDNNSHRPSEEEIKRLIKANDVVDKLNSLRPRWTKTPHTNGQLQFLQSRHKIRIAIPGNGWGKTSTMAMALDMAIQKDDPFNPDMVPKWPVVGVWVCQKFQQMDIMRKQLDEEIWTRPWKWNQSRHFYEWPNGGTLFIVSSDSDWEHIQGIQIDFVCFDEHPDKKLWTELMFRRRGRKKTRYMVAATMTLGKTWFVQEVIQEWEKFHKSRGLNALQARTIQKHPSLWVWDQGGIRDNPIMTEEDYSHYESLSTASSKELKVRLQGGYADFSGESVFEPEDLDRQLVHMSEGTNGGIYLCEPDDHGLILPDGYDGEGILKRRIQGVDGTRYVKWVPGDEVDGGRITLWNPPELDSTYVIGCDFAAGLVGRDYDAAIVLKKREDGKLEQVAEAHGWWGDANFAAILYMLGMWYFGAFIVGERQFGLPALRRLYDEYHYPYLYRGRMETSRSRRPSDLLGHHRSAGDTIIPNLRAAVHRDHVIIKSLVTMEEMRQYQYRPKFKAQDMEDVNSDQLVTSSPTGMHDDLVLAMAYAWHAAREVGRFQMPALDYAPGTYGEVFDNRRILAGKKPRGLAKVPWYAAQ